MNKYLVPQRTSVETIIPVLSEEYGLVSPEVSYPLDTSINDVYIINSGRRLYGFKVYTFFSEKTPDNLKYEESTIKEFGVLGIKLPLFVLTKRNEIYCKVGRYLGALFNFVEGDSFEDEEEYYKSAGGLLGRIHSIPATIIEGISYVPTLNDFNLLFGESLTLDELLDIHKTILMRTEFESMKYVLTKINNLTMSSSNKLKTFVHGEYDKKALRFHERRVSGLLDFESSRIDNPFFDLACAYRNFGCINRNISSPDLGRFNIFIEEYKREFPTANEIHNDFPFYMKIFLGQLIISRLYYSLKTGDFISFKNQEQKLIKEIAWVEENSKFLTDLIKR